jgi:uncharacterized protein (TIGR03663 family)
MDFIMEQKRSWLERPVFESVPFLTGEVLVFALIIGSAIFSRIYDLGARVMSHDENSHVYFEAWQFVQGRGYSHDPMMHGPLTPHLIALSYYLFGANDFTSRLPFAIAGILTVWMCWYWRRYLGKAGAVAAAIMLLISPYMLFYARYARQEATIVLSGIIMLYAVLRYLETGLPRYIYLLIGALAFNYIDKATGFIYTAQLLIWLGFIFVVHVTRRKWPHDDGRSYRAFLISLAAGIALVGGTVIYGLYTSRAGTLSATETAAPVNPTSTATATAAAGSLNPTVGLAALGVVAIVVAFVFLVRGYSLERLLEERSFGLILLLLTLVLPQLVAFPVRMIGWNPLDYSTSGILNTAKFLVPMTIVAIAIGLWWNAEVWIKAALLFYGIFALFYTTFFTNGVGFFSGLVGSLGYWLSQQAVQRGSQPWYYYIGVQIPIYEFLPALASIMALIFGVTRRRPALAPEADPDDTQAEENYSNTFTLLVWWSLSSILAYTLAGEKMPWLTIHIALPLCLLGGWGIGQLIDRIDWSSLRQRRPILAVMAASIFVLSASFAIGYALGNPAPFQGKELDQLQITASFLLALVTAAISGWGLFRLLRDWPLRQVLQVVALVFFGILGAITLRASVRATYILYDSGEEYLVYAHGYTGVKEVMRQVEEISRRVSGGLTMPVAYDDDVSPSFSWYLKDYPNARFYGSQPSRDLRDVPVIIVGDNNFSKIEPVVEDEYYQFDYIRLVWPNQDYFGLTWERIQPMITDSAQRAALFDIWLNRSYDKWAEVTGNTSLTPETWSPADRMRMYVRKDIAAKIWNYGAAAVAIPEPVDPYEGKAIQLPADTVIGSAGADEGQLNAPRGVAVAPDGSLYVADSRNHRIQHFSQDGDLLKVWGTFADAAQGEAPGGTFNEPWGVAVGPDGSVYVTDTWNHRIQKFAADGAPITMWGHYGGADQPDGFWGPRGIAVGPDGKVYITDTGNKRVVFFDEDGNYLGQFGSPGLEAGQFDEPVGITLDMDGNVYVADAWNQRVQVFAPNSDGSTYLPLREWEVSAWESQSLDNKPFIAVNSSGHVFVSDPDGYRVLEFVGETGEIVRTWGDVGQDASSFNLPSGVSLDEEGSLWVSDSGNGRLMRFSPPAQ